MLLRGEHKDGDDEQRGKEHLHEDALRDGHTGAERGRNIQVAGKHCRNDSSRAHAGKHLRDEAEDGADGGERANEIETKRDLPQRQYSINNLIPGMT